MRQLMILVMLVLVVGCDRVNNTTEQVRGSGNQLTRTEAITDFSGINASHTFDVTVRYADSYRVEVRVDDNLEQYLEVRKRGNILVLGLEDGRSYSNTHLEAEITMPRLQRFELSGACEGDFSGFESNDALEIELSGASRLRGDIVAGDVRISVSGASNLHLTGSGRNGVALNISGASNVNLEEFTLIDVYAQVSGASELVVSATGELNVEASGASDVRYVGDPTMGNIETSGASTIRRR